jgi:hypothetical protein
MSNIKVKDKRKRAPVMFIGTSLQLPSPYRHQNRRKGYISRPCPSFLFFLDILLNNSQCRNKKVQLHWKIKRMNIPPDRVQQSSFDQ